MKVVLDGSNEERTFLFPVLVAVDDSNDEQNQQSKATDGHDHGYQYSPVRGYRNCCRREGPLLSLKT